MCTDGEKDLVVEEDPSSEPILDEDLDLDWLRDTLAFVPTQIGWASSLEPRYTVHYIRLAMQPEHLVRTSKNWNLVMMV